MRNVMNHALLLCCKPNNWQIFHILWCWLPILYHAFTFPVGYRKDCQVFALTVLTYHTDSISWVFHYRNESYMAHEFLLGGESLYVWHFGEYGHRCYESNVGEAYQVAVILRVAWSPWEFPDFSRGYTMQSTPLVFLCECKKTTNTISTFIFPIGKILLKSSHYPLSAPWYIGKNEPIEL